MSVQDLCDQLWDICDHRKQEAVSERQRVMTERWLEDKTGLLSNYYFMLLQVCILTYIGVCVCVCMHACTCVCVCVCVCMCVCVCVLCV